MVKRKRSSGRPRNAYRRQVGLLILVVAATVCYVWQKVELAGIARRIDRLEDRITSMQEERSRLMAAIVFRKKPGAIEKIARGQLGMEYPAGRLTELTFEASESGSLE